MTTDESAELPSGGVGFSELANRTIGWLCRNRPELATYLGDHSFDAELTDNSPSAAAERLRRVNDLKLEVSAYPVDQLDLADTVDRDILRIALDADVHQQSEVCDPTWNPMLFNPGSALYLLLSRDFAPLEERLLSVAGRAAQVPDYLSAARERLTDPTHIHTETAIAQLDGLIALLEQTIPAAADGAGQPILGLGRHLEAAAKATRAHQEWLRERLSVAQRDPRLGPELFAGRLALTLATEWDPQALLEQAWNELDATEQDLKDTVGHARDLPSPTSQDIAAEFERLALDMSGSDRILADCRESLAEATRFVTDRDILTLHHDPVEIIEMPEIDRGVAAAYCRGVGPLETAELITQFAVSPTPSGWSDERVASFYREYNQHMLHNLTVHEAMPGHVEQLSHSRRYVGRTKLRSVFTSGSFVEGWAVYAEELMVELGYRSDVSAEAAAALKMQQLKMRLRMLLNTIMDISFHTGDLDEATAMSLMTERGYQEEGEAAGKWRRVQLTSTQLCTYYVGYLEVKKLADDLAVARPGWSMRERHDAMLSFGSPPVRHLRTLLGV